MSSLPFTILTPTFNRADVIVRAFDSLCAQTGPRFEWVVVDDGSTDDTAQVLAACAARAPFELRYVRQPNGHKKVAFNRGVREARGQLLVVLDDDDELAPAALARLWAIWQSIDPSAREHYIGVTGLCQRADGRVVGDRFPADLMDCTATRMFFEHGVRGEKFGCQRVDVLRRYAYPEHIEGFVPESLLWWQIASDGFLTRFVNEVLRRYHSTTVSLSTSPAPSGRHAPGLYLLSWSWIELQLGFWRHAPWAFAMMAARLTRYRLAMRQTRAGAVVARDYPLRRPMGRLLVGLMMPVGYALYARDRWQDARRGRGAQCR